MTSNSPCQFYFQGMTPPQPINQKNMCVDKNMHMNIDNYTILMDKMCKQTQPN